MKTIIKNKLVSIYLYIIHWISKNKLLFSVLVIYAILMLNVIDWGIPGTAHPFNYQMDEWHQLQAVRATFKYFSSNIPGSAHGTMLHFILSGIYLIPFFLLRIVNPFAIKSAVDLLESQHRLFEILRLNSLIFGILSMLTIARIAKDYLKSNQNITVILFVATPLWLALSNYFKYDIALIFWMLLSIFYLLKFGVKPNLKNYIIAGVFCSFAVATKISALPLFIAYIISFFWFSKKIQLRNLFFGLLIFFVGVILLGTPDLVLGKGDYGEYLYSNLISGPNNYRNFLLGFDNWWQYLFVKIFPVDFGYGFLLIYLVGILYWTFLSIKSFFNNNLLLFKGEFFLLLCFLLFSLSLIPLKIGANGNRLLVLLPFFALLSAAFLQRLKLYFNKFKTFFTIVFIFILIIQIWQSMIMIYVKWLPDVRKISSNWMIKNFKKNTLIGIENIPIYQLLPDVVVKEVYSKERIPNFSTNFNYAVIDASSKVLPQIVIITNKELDYFYFKKSSKKQLLDRLKEEGYVGIAEFKPPDILYTFIGNELNLQTSGLVPISTISLFRKD